MTIKNKIRCWIRRHFAGGWCIPARCGKCDVFMDEREQSIRERVKNKKQREGTK
jgi:hypothetical protein